MKNFIKFNNVQYQINHPFRIILSGIDLQIAKNDFVIILGSNGSGKSTLLKLLDRRYSSFAGEIDIENQSIKSYNSRSFAKMLITLTQNPLSSLFPSLTVYENCQIALQQNPQKIKKLLVKSHFLQYLEDFNSNLPNNLDNLAGSLSGGEQQALALALGCLARPKILLLDEHTSALDPHAADRLMKITNEMVKKYEMTCLLTTHNLDIAQTYGTRLIALQQGKIICDYRDDKKFQLSANDLRRCCYA